MAQRAAAEPGTVSMVRTSPAVSFEVRVVRFALGSIALMLAGCTSQPRSAPAPATERAPAPPRAFVLRIGVEHLPPAAGAAGDPRIERTSLAAVRAPRAEARGVPAAVGERTARASERPLLELCDADDPIEREALHFVSDLVEADRRRVRREVGLPFFDFHAVDPDRGPLLASEVAMQEEQEQWLQAHGKSLLRRPVRQLLKRLPIARDVEVELDEFRGQHVPLSEPYQTTHDRRSNWGRVSLRVRASDLQDPVEVVWIRGVVRVGTSQEHGKFGIDLPLTERLRLELRTRTEYETDHTGYRVDLSYHPSLSTSLHVALGDDMDFLSTSSIYSLFESPMDGSPGIVLYAVHIF
jgi:hypothetical protein